MVCCGAGTAADCDKVTDMIGSQLKLLRLDWNRQVRVKTANHLFKQMLFRYQGHIGAYLVLAGADRDGGHLYSIAAHGSTDKTPYTANGSGMLAGSTRITQIQPFNFENAVCGIYKGALAVETSGTLLFYLPKERS